LKSAGAELARQSLMPILLTSLIHVNRPAAGFAAGTFKLARLAFRDRGEGPPAPAEAPVLSGGSSGRRAGKSALSQVSPKMLRNKKVPQD